MLKEKIESLEELKGQEFTLLKMEQLVQDILEIENDESSIFDGETERFIEEGEYAYATLEDGERIDINIKFIVTEKDDEEDFETVVKIDEIEEL